MKPSKRETDLVKLFPEQIAELSVRRGYRPETVAWLSEQGWIGWSGFGGGRWCFPVHDGGRVVSTHQIPREKGTPITYYPKGQGVHPLVIGDPERDSPVLVFESQWDLFAALDAANYPSSPKGVYIATRGAANRLPDSLKIPEGKTLFAVMQNDPEKNGRIPAEEWLRGLREQDRWKIVRVDIPSEYEDPQSWLLQAGFDAFKLGMRDVLEKGKKNLLARAERNETPPPAEGCHPFLIAAEKLAAMTPHESDQLRKEVAKEHGVTLATLDATVSEIRKKKQSAKPDSIVEELSPWPENVTLPDLLREVATTISKHMVLPEGAATAITLWIAGAYVYEPTRIFPKLFITSPEKRCGKTTLLEVIEALSPRALVASNITAAALFRTIEMSKPTIIIDEADTFLANNDELNGIVNSGHTKRLAKVIRTVGDDHMPKTFSTWCPQVIAGIGKQKDTLMDRSIAIKLRRMANGEVAERIPADLFDRKQTLRRKLLKWAKGNAITVANSSPEIPTCSNGRAEDNWRPLIGIAELADGIWPERARKAFSKFNSESEGGDEETMRVQVLRDIQTIFDQTEEKGLWSESLIEKLIEMEDQPWSEYKGGFKPISPHSLGRLLKPFGIGSVQIWESGSNRRGYRRDQFEDAFTRYL